MPQGCHHHSGPPIHPRPLPTSSLRRLYSPRGLVAPWPRPYNDLLHLSNYVLHPSGSTYNLTHGCTSPSWLCIISSTEMLYAHLELISPVSFGPNTRPKTSTLNWSYCTPSFTFNTPCHHHPAFELWVPLPRTFSITFHRSISHHIHLIPNSAPVDIKPYRYLYCQKSKHER